MGSALCNNKWWGINNGFLPVIRISWNISNYWNISIAFLYDYYWYKNKSILYLVILL